jgi:tetratricopeptide (TPR) repeat protein
MISLKYPRIWPFFAIGAVLGINFFPLSLFAGPTDAEIYRRQTTTAYDQAKAQFATATNLSPAAWIFARACYNLADLATNDDTRAALANEGMDACRKLISVQPKSGPAYYYLGMDEGQLARTELLGALSLVRDMERQFKIAWNLDPSVDYGGPARSLGMLYRDAPGWPTSIGSRRKAREWLEKADRFDPNFPENPMVLVETNLKWGNYKEAAKNLQDMDSIWPRAQKKLAGIVSEHDWADWSSRRLEAQRKINEH